jgi:hypothetical protein
MATRTDPVHHGEADRWGGWTWDDRRGGEQKYDSGIISTCLATAAPTPPSTTSATKSGSKQGFRNGSEKSALRSTPTTSGGVNGCARKLLLRTAEYATAAVRRNLLSSRSTMLKAMGTRTAKKSAAAQDGLVRSSMPGSSERAGRQDSLLAAGTVTPARPSMAVYAHTRREGGDD